MALATSASRTTASMLSTSRRRSGCGTSSSSTILRRMRRSSASRSRPPVYKRMACRPWPLCLYVCVLKLPCLCIHLRFFCCRHPIFLWSRHFALLLVRRVSGTGPDRPLSVRCLLAVGSYLFISHAFSWLCIVQNVRRSCFTYHV